MKVGWVVQSVVNHKVKCTSFRFYNAMKSLVSAIRPLTHTRTHARTRAHTHRAHNRSNPSCPIRLDSRIKDGWLLRSRELLWYSFPLELHTRLIHTEECLRVCGGAGGGIGRIICFPACVCECWMEYLCTVICVSVQEHFVCIGACRKDA